MDKPSFKLVGAPCGQHGQYTFYKALRISGPIERIIAIGDFFFVKVWQDSELVSIGELQLLWTDRVSDQTLVSLRLYFLPENTPEGRNQHGEDEVLAINDKVVVRAEDLLSWVCVGSEWRWGRRAVWRGACAPPADTTPTTTHAPLHHTHLDLSDVDTEKTSIQEAEDAPGVVVFSYPRYCRYRALAARLDGIQAAWLRDSLVAALGGYAAPTTNTRILYCKETFEYPELEGHEFVCNHLAPRLKGRPRGRRRRHHHHHHHHHHASDRSDSDDCDTNTNTTTATSATPRRLSLRNGAGGAHSEEEGEDYKREHSPEDRAFLHHLKMFYKERGETFKSAHSLKHLSARALYVWVQARGGYRAVTARQLWHRHPVAARRHYERYLLPFENHERRNGTSIAMKPNGKLSEPHTIDTIDVTDSPLREEEDIKPSPPPHEVDSETGEITNKDDEVKNAEELNREFLESLPKEEKPVKISVKPVEKLIEPRITPGDEPRGLRGEIAGGLSDPDRNFLNNVHNFTVVSECASRPVNGHTAPTLAPTDQRSRDGGGGRSSLRAVRVKPTRTNTHAHTPPNPVRTESASSSPPLSSSAPITNFGIHHPPHNNLQNVDDDIVEVPYKPKTPEIIDLDEYPESPQAVKKKKLDILKERGLEVTPLPPWQGLPPPIILNPAVQHQIMTQAQLFHMYNILPHTAAYPNGLQPPKVIQGSSIYGSTGPEKTVYGNPKDPFMPPPHVLLGAPLKPLRAVPTHTPQDILDLTCKSSPPPHKPAVEIVRVAPSASPQNLTKNYTVVDGKAVVGSNLEITLVNKANRPPQKRSSNGKFMSSKTPTPPTPPKYGSPIAVKKPAIKVPSYLVGQSSALYERQMAAYRELTQLRQMPLLNFGDTHQHNN